VYVCVFVCLLWNERTYKRQIVSIVQHKPFVVDSLVICSILGSTKNKIWMEGWPDRPDTDRSLSLWPACLCRQKPYKRDRQPYVIDTLVPSQRWKWVAVSSPPAMMKEQLYFRVGCSIYPRDIMEPIVKTGIPSPVPGIEFRSSSQHCDTLTAKSSRLGRTVVLYILPDAVRTPYTFCKYSLYTA
jgi:hypothetical protein